MGMKTDAEIKAMAMATDGPLPDEVYRHYRGGAYLIVARAIDEATLTPSVVYRAMDTKVIWVRPLDDFMSGVEVDGVTRPRFIRYL